MRSEPDFLTLEEVLSLHTRQLSRYGGAPGIRDQGSLESAVGMPQQSFGGEFVHPDVFSMAAAYAFHIAQNQPFADGNKRTGLAAALVFLELNDFPLIEGEALPGQEGKLYEAMIGMAERRLGKEGLSSLLCELCQAPASRALREIRVRGPQAEAEGFVRYFQQLQRPDRTQDDEWEEGLRLSREWLRLLDCDSPSTSDIDALLLQLGERRDTGSAWDDLQLRARYWARTRKFGRQEWFAESAEQVIRRHDDTFRKLAQ